MLGTQPVNTVHMHEAPTIVIRQYAFLILLPLAAFLQHRSYIVPDQLKISRITRSENFSSEAH